ncbi:MAG: hypothetical protein GX413_07045 [Acetobacter sp.]|nr:hypothetical protein [Acetobacter sp.]
MLKKVLRAKTESWRIKKSSSQEVTRLSEEDCLYLLKIVKEIADRKLVGSSGVDACIPDWIVQTGKGVTPRKMSPEDFYNIISWVLSDCISVEDFHSSDEYQNIKMDPLFQNNS